MTVKLIKFILLFKNATSKLKSFITIPYQYDLIKFVEFFYKEGLIQYFSIEKNLKHKIASIKIFLRYFKTFNVFSQLKIISKKKISIHLKYIDICKIFEKNSTFVISTNFGLFTILDCKKYKIGGKVLLKF
jgi:ribosomal protein S8